MALFHTSPYHPWMLYKTLQVGYCLGTATHKRLLWSEAVISFPWVSVHVSALKVTWLYSGERGKFSQKLVKKNRGYFCPATFYPPAPFRFSSYFWPPSPPSFFLGTNTSPTLLGSQALFHWHTQLLFRFGHRQTDIFVIICSDFQEALSLLVYRNLWYMDAQVCFLKVLFKTWIDHFFQINTEISSDGRLKILITFRFNNLFDASRVASIFRLI